MVCNCVWHIEKKSHELHISKRVLRQSDGFTIKIPSFKWNQFIFAFGNKRLAWVLLTFLPYGVQAMIRPHLQNQQNRASLASFNSYSFNVQPLVITWLKEKSNTSLLSLKPFSFIKQPTTRLPSFCLISFIGY